MADIENSVKNIEKYLIILLGVDDHPIPSLTHLQKEMFVLSKAIPKIGDFVKFQKHYLGPYSEDLSDIVKEPVYFSSAIEQDPKKGYKITDEGKQILEKMVGSNKENPKFLHLIALAKMVRKLYDRLTKDELLLLIYLTYNEYTEFSSVSEKLLSPERRRELSRSLLNKGLITESRFKEIIGEL
jgi:uncharacterized protein YwgA